MANSFQRCFEMKLHSVMMKNATEAVIKIKRWFQQKVFNSTADFSFRKSKDTLTPSFTPVTSDGIRTRNKNHTRKLLYPYLLFPHLLCRRIYC